MQVGGPGPLGPDPHPEAEMFAPSINVDLEKLKGDQEAKPPARKPKKVAARGGTAAAKAAEKPATDK